MVQLGRSAARSRAPDVDGLHAAPARRGIGYRRACLEAFARSCPVQAVRTCSTDRVTSAATTTGRRSWGEAVEADQQQAKAHGHSGFGHGDADVREEVVTDPAQQRETEGEGAANVAGTAFCDRSRYHSRMYRGDSVPVVLHDEDADRRRGGVVPACRVAYRAVQR